MTTATSRDPDQSRTAGLDAGHLPLVGAAGPPDTPTSEPPPLAGASWEASVYLAVRFYAELVDDIERIRIATGLRLERFTDTSEHGHGIPEWHPHLVPAADLYERLRIDERAAVLQLKRVFRLLPVAPFVRDTLGLGEKTVARYLGVVGDPAWHSRDNRPRTLPELYAYSGLHVAAGAAPRRKRGQRANWNIRARTRAYTIAERAMMHRRSPYRVPYDEQRIKHADLPALHAHNRALRYVAKRIVRDLWRVAKAADR